MKELYKTARRWPEVAWRLLYPSRCLICGAVLTASDPPNLPCCCQCLAAVPLAGLYCPWCGCFYKGPGECCLDGGSLRSLFALSFHQGEWRKMLHRLKYRGQRQLSRPLGEWLGTALLRTGWALDLVVFIPLHPRKALERGYNQSELLARQVAKALKLPLVPALEKVKDTPSQTGLSRRERYKNTTGAFLLKTAVSSENVVLLVDDIYTTGATMKEAAKVLGRSGAAVYGTAVAFQAYI